MFRSRAHPCYPEDGQPDGCFPDNSERPSPFECWLAGAMDRTSPRDLLRPASKHPSRRTPAGWLFEPDR